MKLALFLVGAGIGAPTRYLIDNYFRRDYRFPIGILIVNVIGSFVLGLVIGGESDTAFLLFGFCGALTTWSAFALDLFAERTKVREFSLNLLGNYLFGVAAALFALWLTR
ncbi:MAG: fluoride efflux transporter FluC [Actinomycetales bacterium]|jgi:CrcB protein